MRKRIRPARAVVMIMNQLTGMLSRIGIILVVFYFAFFSWGSQVRAVEYPLPYPGILPDHPLYFLKVARDTATAFLVGDPVKKSFYLLLLADKRLAAGEMLVNQGKSGVGAETLVQAEEYYRKAVDGATQTKNEDLLAKLTVAGAKHDEVLTKMAGKISEKENSDLRMARQNNLEARKRIMELLLVTSFSRRIFAPGTRGSFDLVLPIDRV